MTSTQLDTDLILPEDKIDVKEMAALFQKSLGPGACVRAACSLRDYIPPHPDFGWGVYRKGRLAGFVRASPFHAGEGHGLWIGPLIVREGHQGQGIGRLLIKKLIHHAQEIAQIPIFFLIGESSYYAQFGFQIFPPDQLYFPRPVDPQKILFLEHQVGSACRIYGRLFPDFKP